MEEELTINEEASEEEEEELENIPPANDDEAFARLQQSFTKVWPI